ncbi:DNA-directed RNA polymerase subunit H [Halapricum sp. CBA1109]|jgi:DNA-directed RNA polymerase subunit H|uniref:DNA-directed RNA polymerase subunit H n=1 Tax=Halapricum sp. CBA1109 TaxID=2668068 RepID=UPI0012FBB635|nr:DNA-directed RNA polymerase subunit H [Halapricum sp. CBA1109]MUV90030.1 DNA-directed RNA polymerase subunit H [Halapricum sp. CBA1109]
MVDVSQHELVPDHTVLDDAELEDVLEEYDIKKTDLPKIQRRDKALPDDAEVGDVVKIVRDSRTTDTAVVYRLVID